MAKTVVGLFDTTQEAQSVIQDLVNHNFNRNNISLVANDPNGEHMQHNSNLPRVPGDAAQAAGDVAHNAGEHAANAAGGAVGGAVTGGILGGGLGLVLGLLGAVAIPVVGPIIAAGPIAAALTGAGIGAVAGGLLGVLTHLGVPEEDANYYAEGVHRGGTLLMVNAPEDQAQTAYDIMQQHGAVDIEERGSQYKQSGWSGYNPDAPMNAANQVGSTISTTTSNVTSSQPVQAVEGAVQEGVTQVRRGARIY